MTFKIAHMKRLRGDTISETYFHKNVSNLQPRTVFNYIYMYLTMTCISCETSHAATKTSSVSKGTIGSLQTMSTCSLTVQTVKSDIASCNKNQLSSHTFCLIEHQFLEQISFLIFMYLNKEQPKRFSFYIGFFEVFLLLLQN